MARMLGRWLTGGCRCGKQLKRGQRLGPDCAGNHPAPRRFKRAEQRQTARDITAVLQDQR